LIIYSPCPYPEKLIRIKLTNLLKLKNYGEKMIIVLATTNKGKTNEIREMLKDFPVTIKNLSDFGPIPEVVEDGGTFDENAYKKSSFTAKILGLPALADDSGLEVEALGKKPGVYSARYSGEDATDETNNKKLLSELKNFKKRDAAFQCVLSLAVPSGPALTWQASCQGEITLEPRGNNGFGYDPVFFHSPSNKTFGQMTLKEKSEISHRGKTLKQFKEEFPKIMEWLNTRLKEEHLKIVGEIHK